LRQVKVPDHSTINNWVEEFQTTAFAIKNYLETVSEPCGHQKTLKSTSQPSCSPIWSLTHSVALNKVIRAVWAIHFYFTPIKQTLQEL